MQYLSVKLLVSMWPRSWLYTGWGNQGSCLGWSRAIKEFPYLTTRLNDQNCSIKETSIEHLKDNNLYFCAFNYLGQWCINYSRFNRTAVTCLTECAVMKKLLEIPQKLLCCYQKVIIFGVLPPDPTPRALQWRIYHWVIYHLSWLPLAGSSSAKWEPHMRTVIRSQKKAQLVAHIIIVLKPGQFIVAQSQSNSQFA